VFFSQKKIAHIFSNGQLALFRTTLNHRKAHGIQGGAHASHALLTATSNTSGAHRLPFVAAKSAKGCSHDANLTETAGA